MKFYILESRVYYCFCLLYDLSIVYIHIFMQELTCSPMAFEEKTDYLNWRPHLKEIM